MKFLDAANYEVHVKEHLDQSWSGWFDGFQIQLAFDSNGTAITIILGRMIGQPTLHGLFAKLRDLGLTILLVKRQD